MLKRLSLLLLLLLLSGSMHTSAWGAASTSLSVMVDHGVPLNLSAPANSIFIANPDIADVQAMSPTSIMIFGKRTGETTFMATDASGATLAQYTIDVTQDLLPLRQELAASMPGSKIRVESVPNGIVLTGQAKDPTAIADAYKIAMRYIPGGGDIINRVQVTGSNQIMIRVRFAEVERSVDNQLGIDWNSGISFGGFVLGIVSGNPISNVISAGASLALPTVSTLQGNNSGSSATELNQGLGNGLATPQTAAQRLLDPFARANNTTLAQPNDGISLSRAGKNFNLNNVIDALSQDGLVTILAEPNLTAMSGETANFLAGGEFPIPVPQGNNQIGIQFKDYGISLEFTPTILGDNRINLHIKPEVSELTTTGAITIDQISVPALLTRKAETTVEVASGQSFAIAGLMDNSQSQIVNKYPILGDMPILGSLFRDSKFINGQTELVIVITPYIVKPSDEPLALPTDGMSPPSEQDRLAGLRTNSSDPNTRTQSGMPIGVKVDPSGALPVPPVPSSELMPADAVPPAPAPEALPALPVQTVKTVPVAKPKPVPVIPAPAPAPKPVSVPAPAQAPVPTPTPAPVPTPAPAPVAIPPAPSAHDKPATVTPPAGPGGFILE